MEFFVNMTVVTTGTALLILLVKKVFSRVMTPRQQLAMWLVLLLQICIFPIGSAMDEFDILPKSSFSLQNYLPYLGNVRVENTKEAIEGRTDRENDYNSVYSGDITMKSPVTGNLITKEVTVNKFQSGILKGILFSLWAIGTAVMAAVLVVGYFRFMRKCSLLSEVSDRKVLLLFESCKEQLGIKKEIALRTGADSPVIIGILKPFVCISDDYSIGELRHVLIHELCHYRHRDIYINLCISAVLCAFWYNPVMWLCFRIVRKDVELCCDQRAIEATGEKQEYARVLLKTAAGKEKFVLASTSFINGEKEVTQRIQGISKYKKPGIIAGIAAVLVIAVVVVVSLTGGLDGSKTADLTVSEADLLSSVSVVAPMITIPSDWTLIEEIRRGTTDGTEAAEAEKKKSKDYTVRANRDLEFKNEKGHVFAGTTFIKAENKVRLELYDRTNNKLNSLNESEIASHAFKNNPAFSKAPFESDILEIKDSENKLLNKVCTAVAEQDGKTYNYAFGFGEEVYTVWAESEYADHEELVKIIETLDILPQGVDKSSPFFKAYQDSKRINILLLGINDNMTDTIALASFDMESKNLDIISIPRDTFYQRLGYDSDAAKKLNAAYMGNPLNTAYAVSNMLFGVPIHYYAVLEYEGVEAIVEAIGGVPMDIPKDMVYSDPYDNPPLEINIPKGNQILDGEKAVQFLRYRSGYSKGDLGRVKEQQEFLKSALKQCLKGDLFKIAKTVTENVKTNLTPDEAKTLAAKAVGIKSENIAVHMLPHTLKMEAPWYLYPNYPEVENLLRRLYGMKPALLRNPDKTTPSAADVNGGAPETPPGWVATPEIPEVKDPNWITTESLPDVSDPGWITTEPLPDVSDPGWITDEEPPSQ